MSMSGDRAGKKSELVTLTEEALHALGVLKDTCITDPMLAFTDFERSFWFWAYASKEGIGAVLLQKQEDGHYYPVTYGSQALSAHEQNYHSSKLEFLVLKWAMTKHFKEHLKWKPFIIQTDNNPLTYIMTMPNLDVMRYNWVGSLSQYTFDIK